MFLLCHHGGESEGIKYAVAHSKRTSPKKKKRGAKKGDGEDPSSTKKGKTLPNSTQETGKGKTVKHAGRVLQNEQGLTFQNKGEKVEEKKIQESLRKRCGKPKGTERAGRPGRKHG